ncbi:hypothetical protein B0I21_11554 [Sphingobacterium paludis]|uniref:ImpB/mucB/samB family protein n=1 Tax=Sphingobacterium paludis TaxID=1476465 RepID=A0A4R7CS45_9SPHI|nr:hypothetical protein B0I21_11554 [Sphingobacterium paludis]
MTKEVMMDRAIVHMDMDTFFVSCERLKNSKLNGGRTHLTVRKYLNINKIKKYLKNRSPVYSHLL